MTIVAKHAMLERLHKGFKPPPHHDLHILRRQLPRLKNCLLTLRLRSTSKMIFARPILAVTLLATYTAAQSCTLDFYFNLAGEFNCGGFPLETATADVTSCADISTITLPVLGKHWNAFNGVDVPAGCSGLSPRLEKKRFEDSCMQR
jgi:hypothetical protein